MGVNVLALGPRDCLMVEGNPKTRAALELADDGPIAALAAEENALGGEDEPPMPSPRRSRAATAAARPEASEAEASTNGDVATTRSTDDAGTGTGEDTGAGTDTAGGSGGALGDASASTTSTSSIRIDPEDERQSFGDGNRRGRRRRRGRGGQEQGGRRAAPARVPGRADRGRRACSTSATRATASCARGGYLPAHEGRVRLGVAGAAVRAPQGRLRQGLLAPAGEQREVPRAAPRRRDQRHDARRGARAVPRFEDLTPLFPDSKLRLELADEPHEITGSRSSTSSRRSARANAG